MANGKKPERGIAVHERRGPGALAWPEEVDRLLDRAFRFPRRWPRMWPAWRGVEREALWMPDMDIFERDGKTVVRVDLPGMKREDIEVAVERDMLVIRGHRKEEKEIKEEDYYCAERATGEFTRSMALPEDVTAESLEAAYQDGVLEVVIPTPETTEATATKVPVK